MSILKTKLIYNEQTTTDYYTSGDHPSGLGESGLLGLLVQVAVLMACYMCDPGRTLETWSWKGASSSILTGEQIHKLREQCQGEFIPGIQIWFTIQEPNACKLLHWQNKGKKKIHVVQYIKKSSISRYPFLDKSLSKLKIEWEYVHIIEKRHNWDIK